MILFGCYENQNRIYGKHVILQRLKFVPTLINSSARARYNIKAMQKIDADRFAFFPYLPSGFNERFVVNRKLHP